MAVRAIRKMYLIHLFFPPLNQLVFNRSFRVCTAITYHVAKTLYASCIYRVFVIGSERSFEVFSCASHFCQTSSLFSALNLLAIGKRSRQTNGLHASISIRLIVKSPLSRFSGGSRGSRSEVHDLRI